MAAQVLRLSVLRSQRSPSAWNLSPMVSLIAAAGPATAERTADETMRCRRLPSDVLCSAVSVPASSPLAVPSMAKLKIS